MNWFIAGIEKNGTGIDIEKSGLGVKAIVLLASLLWVGSLQAQANDVSVDLKGNQVSITASFDGVEVTGSGYVEDNWGLIALRASGSSQGEAEAAIQGCAPGEGSGMGCTIQNFGAIAAQEIMWGVAEVVLDDPETLVVIYSMDTEGTLTDVHAESISE